MTSALMAELQAIAGGKHAFDAAHPDFARYLRVFGIRPGDLPEFEAVVRPVDVESLQQCVRVAGKHGLAIWSAFNAAGNGAQLGAPGAPGIAIDLQRMNRILAVDTKSACALVEPGVSYRQLQQHLAEKGIGFWVDSDRNAGNSIAGSICSRHVGYTPYGDHMLMQCGMELVLHDGELLRTGMGALPGSDAWQLFKYNFGPYLDGLFTQSSFALPTKVGLWLMPAPPKHLPFRVTLPGDAAMHQAIENLRPLAIAGAVGNAVTIHCAALDAAPYSRREKFAGSNGILDAAKLMQARGYGAWNLYAALYGAPENLELMRDMVFSALGAISGAAIETDEDAPDDPAWRDLRTLMGGGTVEKEIGLEGWGGAGVMTLAAAAPVEGAHAQRLGAIAARVTSENRMDYLGAYRLAGRTLLKQVYLPYDPDDRASFDHAAGAGRRLMQEFARAGYGLVDESAELRRAADELHAGSPLAGLVATLRGAVSAPANAAQALAVPPSQQSQP